MVDVPFPRSARESAGSLVGDEGEIQQAEQHRSHDANPARSAAPTPPRCRRGESNEQHDQWQIRTAFPLGKVHS